MIVKAIYPSKEYLLEAQKPALINLSKNFTLAEMANNAGDASKPQYIFSKDSDDFITALQAFRDIANQRVIINSGYRQPAYNIKIGGTSNSRHIFGQAADIQPLDRFTATDHIKAWAEALGYTGHKGAINVYKNHEYYHLETNDSQTPFLLVRVYSTIGELIELRSSMADYAIYVDSYVK